jgi:hydrogenase maturation protease
MPDRAVPEAGGPRPGVLVLGLGNVLWADEGFGVRAVEALHRRWSMPAAVSVVDGGTQGVYLLDHVCSAGSVLVLDAIDFDLAPGTLQVFRDAEVPEGSARAMSLHQATFQELLSLARVRGRYPDRITLVGVQPEVLDDLGGSLSAVVRARLDEAVELAVAELRTWGVAPVERAEPAQEPLGAAALGIEAYEAGRPSASEACRIGDARFMNQTRGSR